MGWDDWADLAQVRLRLDQGADPNTARDTPPLHRAAWAGAPEVVAELARLVDDVDEESEGHTALFAAVFHKNAAAAKVLVEAGADPWREMIGHWSPGRLNLAGTTPGLFHVPRGQAVLNWPERAAAAEARLLNAALSSYEIVANTGLACVAGLDVAEVIRRLGAERLTETGPGSLVGDIMEDPMSHPMDESARVVGVTEVPGGCVLVQPWGCTPNMSGLLDPLTEGTIGYGYYANPKGAEHGSLMVNGHLQRQEELGLFPPESWWGWDYDGEVEYRRSVALAMDVFYAYLLGHSAAYACAMTGLRPADARAFDGTPDQWIRLPASWQTAASMD
jgi:hypothetical protein